MKVYRKIEGARATKGATSWSRRDSGQMTIVVALAMGTFLLGFVGFGADMTNLWFHRQSAQNAADSACMAGAMDMLLAANAGTPNAATGGLGAGLTPFTAGTPFDCGSGNGLGAGNHLPNSVPCKYAKLNGYNGTGFPGNAQREGNQVSVSFPASIPGVAAPDASAGLTYPFMRVDVLDRVKVYFSAMFGGSGVQDVVSTAKCGLQGGVASVPLLVLNTTELASFSDGGTPLVKILGGPTRSIQVNSKNSLAALVSNNPQIDLTQGGPNYNGSSFGVTGGPSNAPAGFVTNPPASWQSSTVPIPDPFRKLAPPSVTTSATVPTAGTSKTVLPGVDGCPITATTIAAGFVTCTEYSAGSYPTGIIVQTQVALFAPGVYYVGGLGLQLLSNSAVRPTDPGGVGCLPLLPVPPCHTASAAGDGSMGTVFYLDYLATGATVTTTANTGSTTAVPGLSSFDTSNARCPGQAAFDSRLSIPSGVDGNVLLAPCTTNGTYETTPTNVGSGASPGKRGMLFFQNRAKAALPQFHGQGALLLNGAMYFHDCPNSMTGPCSNPPTDYQTQLGLWGGSGTGTQLIGQIVVDKLSLAGNSSINMDLSPQPFDGLSVALLQ